MIDFNPVTGGADGQWVWVENLNPEGDLSLRHALTRNDIPGPRNIGFKVSGDIFGSIDVKNLSDFTLHGATSPGGICLRNTPDDMADTLNIRTNNVIIDNIRIRPGHAPDVPNEKRRALNFQTTKGAIVSNCSLTWAYDQIVGAWYGCEDILFYRNIIAEGFRDFGGGKFGMGVLIGDAIGNTGGGDVYFYQNIFAHNKDRNPKTNIAGITYFWNNLIYNPGDWAFHLDNRFGAPRADVIGNVLIPGAQSNNNSKWLVRADEGATLFLYDNISPNRKWYQPQSTGLVYGNKVDYVDTPFMPDIPFEIVPAQNLQNHLLEVVGPQIDSVDARILSSVHDRSGKHIENEAEVGGYDNLFSPDFHSPRRVVVSIPVTPPSVSGVMVGRDFIRENGDDRVDYIYEVY